MAKFILLSLDDSTNAETLGGKVTFISALVKLCHQQEGQRYSSGGGFPPIAATSDERLLTSQSLRIQPMCHQVPDNVVDSEAGASHLLRRAVSHVRDDMPQVFRNRVCLLYGRAFKREFTLDRHLEIHVKAGRFVEPFQCRVVGCTTWLRGKSHYKNHCATAHRVLH